MRPLASIVVVGTTSLNASKAATSFHRLRMKVVELDGQFLAARRAERVGYHFAAEELPSQGSKLRRFTSLGS